MTTATATLDPEVLQASGDSELADAYTRLKKHKDQLEDKIKSLDAMLDAVKQVFLQRMNADNVSQIKLNDGKATISRVVQVKSSCEDWDTFGTWLANQLRTRPAEDAGSLLSFFERRLSKTAVTEFMDAHEGQLPPAVNVATDYGIRVTLSKK